MVAVEQFPSILPRQYSVLHYLRRRGVLQDDGWGQLVQAHIALAESLGMSAVQRHQHVGALHMRIQ